MIIDVYGVRPRRDRRGFDLISDALPFGGLWYTKPDDAVSYAKFSADRIDAVIHVLLQQATSSRRRSP